MPVASDQQLLSQVRAGNSRAFTEIHDKYRRRLLAYCHCLLQDRVIAEDVVQIAFQKAYESLATLDNPDLFFYWLFSIARNEVYGHIRKTRKNGTPRSIEEEDDIWTEETPHEQLVRKETTEIVELFLNRLKVEYREVLVLRQYDKLSYAEIAAITGDTVSSVESRLFKARKALAKKLAPYFL